MPSISRLQRRRDELQTQYDLLSEKIQHLRAAHAIETSAAVHFQLEKQIEQAEAERDEIEQQMDALDAEIARTPLHEPGASDQAVGDVPGKGVSRQKVLTELRQILDARFDAGELRTLCFDLGVDYDDLPGEGKSDKARELVAYLERHGRLSELIRTGKQLRPDIAWGKG